LVGLSVMEERIAGLSLEFACTLKNSVKNKSGGPLSATRLMKGKPVTSCIGASAEGQIDEFPIPSLVRAVDIPAPPGCR